MQAFPKINRQSTPFSNDFQEKFILSKDNLRLYYRDYQPRSSITSEKNITILCLAGLTRNSKDFHAVAQRYSQHYRVICPDYRGRGLSQYDPNWQNYKPMTYVRDILRIWSHEKLNNVIIMGTSMGGLLSMGISLFRPFRIKGIVLNDIGPEIHLPGLERIMTNMQNISLPSNWDQAMRNLRHAYPHLLLETDDEWMHFTQSTFRAHHDGNLVYDWDPNLSKALAKDSKVPNLWRLFYFCRHIPTLVLRGEHSDILTHDIVEKMADKHQKLAYHTIPHAAHTPTLSEPISRLVLNDFVAGLGMVNPEITAVSSR